MGGALWELDGCFGLAHIYAVRESVKAQILQKDEPLTLACSHLMGEGGMGLRPALYHGNCPHFS